MISALVMLLFALAPAAVFAQSATAEADIRAVRRTSNEAIRRHDLQAFAASLTDDLVVVAGNGGFIPTREAYIQRFAEDFADPKAVVYERIIDSVEISKEAPLAAEHGHWVGTRPDGSRAFGGTYLAMWRKTSKGWKIRSELFVRLN